MKTLLLLASTLFCFQHSLAQSDYRTLLTISAGPSIPIGSFAKREMSEDAGQASIGAFIDLGVQFPISQDLKGIALIRGKINGVNLRNFQGISGSSTTIETTVWKSAAVFAGLAKERSLNESKTSALTFRGMMGLQRTTSPKINIRMAAPGGTYSGSQDAFSATSVSYLLGAGFRFKLNSLTSFRLSADYIGTNPKFEVMTGSFSNTGSYKTEARQKISTIDVGLGLMIKI